MTKHSEQRNHADAFTLVELLAVIAIIASLAALLFPVLSQVKRSAKGVVCISNLRQIGIAEKLYLADNNDIFPKTVNGIEKLDQDRLIGGRPYGSDPTPYETPVQAYQTYLKNKNVWQCPLDSGNPVLLPGGGGKLYLYNGGTSYFFSDFFLGQSSSSIEQPSDWVYGCDGGGLWHYSRQGPGDMTFRVNCIYEDGHAKYSERSMPSFFYSQYNPNGN